MNKLFDLRFVIGSFFSIVGLILFLYSFSATGAADVNRYCGIGFLIFGILMLIFSLQKKKADG